MSHIHKIKDVVLDNTKLNIYSTNAILNIDEQLSAISNELNSAQYPREISDMIISISGVSLLEISDLNDNILLITSNILPEYIDNYE